MVMRGILSSVVPIQILYDWREFMKGFKFRVTRGMALFLAIVMCVGIVIPASFVRVRAGGNEVTDGTPVLRGYDGWFESAYVQWDSSSNLVDSYKVYVKKAADSEFTVALDNELVRVYEEDGINYYRADALGLSAGTGCTCDCRC